MKMVPLQRPVFARSEAKSDQRQLCINTAELIDTYNHILLILCQFNGKKIEETKFALPVSKAAQRLINQENVRSILFE